MGGSWLVRCMITSRQGSDENQTDLMGHENSEEYNNSSEKDITSYNSRAVQYMQSLSCRGKTTVKSRPHAHVMSDVRTAKWMPHFVCFLNVGDTRQRQ